MSADIARLHQCTELIYILVGDIVDLLDEPANEQTCRWLSAVLDTLLDKLPEEYTLKSEDGYLSDVLDTFPAWQSQVELLEEQNFILMRELRRLRRTVCTDSDFRKIADEVRVGLMDWIGRYQSHHERERDLIQQAANLVIGGDG